MLISGLLQGFGLGCTFVPLNTLALSTLPRHLLTQGTAMRAVMRNVGGSIGISILIGQLTDDKQVVHSRLVEHLRPDNPLAHPSLLPSPFSLTDPRGLAALNAEVSRQAEMIAYINDFALMMALVIAAMALLLLVRRQEGRRGRFPAYCSIYDSVGRKSAARSASSRDALLFRPDSDCLIAIKRFFPCLNRTTPGRSRRPSCSSRCRSGAGRRRNRPRRASGSGFRGRATRRRNRRRASNAPPVADPLVDRDPVLLARRVPGIGHEGLVAERGQRRADDPDPGAVGAHRHLLEAGDHLLGGDLLLGLGPAVAQIVGAEHDDDMRDAGLRQHVAVEPPEAAVAAQIVQDAVAAEPVVHDPDRAAAFRGEIAGELVRPAAERVDRRDVAVGQRVAERDDAARLGGGQHVDAAQEKPLVRQIADRHHGLGREIAAAARCNWSAAHSGR